MLILTRKLNEVITIGDDIQVKVLSIKGGQVRLGIDAPKEVQVCRGNVGQSSEGVLTDPAMQQ